MYMYIFHIGVLTCNFCDDTIVGVSVTTLENLYGDYDVDSLADDSVVFRPFQHCLSHTETIEGSERAVERRKVMSWIPIRNREC